MSGLVWSFALAAVGIFGLYIAGKKLWWGWAIGLGAQVLWIAYAIVTRQWGFIASALAYGWVYGRNAYRWRVASAEDAHEARLSAMRSAYRRRRT